MKGTKRITALLLCLCMTVALLSGCQKTAGDGQETDTSASDGRKSLVIGTGQSCGTLDPLQSYDGWYAVRFGYGQTLTKLNDDFSVSGWLAEDNYTVNEDHTVWTFTIKEGITFSNGTELTADMAKASLENVYANGTRGEEYFTPASIEADGQTLTITTEIPEPILPNKLADPYFTIIDTTADMSDIAEKGPIGTGPFVIDSFDPVTKETVVVKNENYWGGEVLMDQITFVYTEDQSTLTMGLQSGDFDAVYNISMTNIAEFDNNDSYHIVRTASGRTTHGFMNQNGLLKDETLRQAIMRYLNKESYCENLLNGEYVVGKTLLTSASAYGYEELTDINAYDPQSAVRLLDEAGYEDIDGDGYRETPEGEKINLRFVYYTGRPEQQVVVEAAQMELAKLGIQVTPEVHDTQTVIDMLASGDYDLLCMSINALNCGDPENHMTTYFKTGGSYNSFGYSSTEFDAVMDELAVTADPDQRTELVKEAEQILMDDSVCIYFCYPVMNFVTQSNVSGITSTPADFYWVSEDTDILS
ncbi:MAG: ABC transporter substrate-binding protein [Ruminococcus sp.]|jgi:peptide/nickel transport system substrate-binding protein